MMKVFDLKLVDIGQQRALSRISSIRIHNTSSYQSVKVTISGSDEETSQLIRCPKTYHKRLLARFRLHALFVVKQVDMTRSFVIPSMA